MRTEPIRHTARLRRIALVTTVAGAVALAGGCGAGADSGLPPLGTSLSASNDQRKADYEKSMEQMRASLDAPSAPAPERSIRLGKRSDLIEMAQRWDQAIAIVQSVKPPDDIAVQHKRMVAAMKDLSGWNHRIVQAAPNAKRTQALGAAAQKSAAAKSFRRSMTAIEELGYHVLSSSEGPGDPMGGEPTSPDQPVPSGHPDVHGP